MPDHALLADDRLRRHWDAWASRPDALPPELLEPGFVDRMLRVWDASEFVAQSVLRAPELLAGLQAEGRLERANAPGELAERLRGALAEAPHVEGLERVLRRFRRAEMVRVIWRDILRAAPLAETLENLSELADCCVAGALERLYAWAVDTDGAPRDSAGREQPLVVLGMGKLGARELNLSSDIDLIFTFPQHGETDGARRRSNEEFFTRLGRQLIKVLSRTTVDGFVFRVDMRLRPFGDAGPLAMSFDAFESYYASQAREWERYAMIKARVIAGHGEAADEFMAMLRPFVYRRYIDFGAIDSIRNMKLMIARELHNKGMDANIKLGPGGIREIEFIGQAFQLVRGGRDTELQVRPILEVLRRLDARDLLPGYAVAELSQAYEFLRLVENRLQAWKDEQTHRLPADDEGRARLARSMGFDGWPAFEVVLRRHRDNVDQHFHQVFAAPQVDADARNADLVAVWHGAEKAERLRGHLAAAGYAEPGEALERIAAFRASAVCRSLSTRGHDRLDRLMPLLLDAIAQSEAPDVALDRLLTLLSAVARRTAYLDLLVENPLALSQLVRLGSASSWVASQLTRQPILLDELLDPRRLYTPLRRSELDAELDVLLRPVAADDLEQQMERLRQFAQGNMLRVAAADLTDVIPLRVVSDYLTDLAESVLARATGIAFDHLARKHGRPTQILGEQTGFGVIGYGKLGGIELGYGSDLDLVFLHGSRSTMAMTEGVDGRREVANEVFYARMGQRLIHLLTTRTPAGVLYEADMRLRPNGNAGMLVSSLSAFEQYQHHEAWTWEHQALLRARPVAGEPAVLEAFRRIRREVLGRERDPVKLLADVTEMRAKMRQALDKTAPERFDLKQGVGGIADIEFMVQYAVLRWAHRHPDLLDWTDNLRLLEGLARYDLLEGHAAELLANLYQVLRAAYHRNALQESPGLIPDAELREERAMVRDLWDRLMGAPG